MSQVILDIPDESILSLKLSEQTVGGEIRMAAAMKLFEMSKLSSGAAARLAGTTRVDFLKRLIQYGVPFFDMSEEEFAQETRLG